MHSYETFDIIFYFKFKMFEGVSGGQHKIKFEGFIGGFRGN